MKNKTMLMSYRGKNVIIKYSIREAENVRVFLLDPFDEYLEGLNKAYFCHEPIEIVIAKFDCCYYISCPGKGSSCPAVNDLDDNVLIGGLLHDAGYTYLEGGAIALLISTLTREGF